MPAVQIFLLEGRVEKTSFFVVLPINKAKAFGKCSSPKIKEELIKKKKF